MEKVSLGPKNLHLLFRQTVAEYEITASRRFPAVNPLNKTIKSQRSRARKKRSPLGPSSHMVESELMLGSARARAKRMLRPMASFVRLERKKWRFRRAYAAPHDCLDPETHLREAAAWLGSEVFR